MKKYIMALDAGTTSNRCILFNAQGEICSMAQREFKQIFPKPGWVEHDADEIWATSAWCGGRGDEQDRRGQQRILRRSELRISGRRRSSGIRHTGEPVYHAIVWQCRRTSEYCD